MGINKTPNKCLSCATFAGCVKYKLANTVEHVAASRLTAAFEELVETKTKQKQLEIRLTFITSTEI